MLLITINMITEESASALNFDMKYFLRLQKADVVFHHLAAVSLFYC